MEDIEIINIIDTAVKIGLGALITGIITYLLANRQFKNDLKKKTIEDKKHILREVSLKLERCELNLNEAGMEYVSDGMKGLLSEPMVKACDKASKARGLSNLIGQVELSNNIGKMLEISEEIHKELRKPNNIASYNTKVDEFSESKEAIYPLISRAYKNVSE